MDLFSGIGGFSLGLERAGFKTVAFCEIEPFCREILNKHWPDTPIFEDIKNLDGRQFRGKIDVICGGFPCQPFSVAGRKKGTQDKRDLWLEMFRVIQQAQPSWVIGENVANFSNMAFNRSKIDLESEGYTVQPFIIPACAVGAPHRRDRVWIIAYADGKRCQPGGDHRKERSILHNKNGHAEKDKCSGNIGQRGACSVSKANSNYGCKRIQRYKSQALFGQQAFSWCKNVRRTQDYFDRPDIPKPLICRDSDGFSSRVDRLKALGNAVVPQIPEIIANAIIHSMKS